MKPTILILGCLVCLATLPPISSAETYELTLTVMADTTFAGNEGIIVRETYSGEGFPDEIEDIAAFPEDGKLRVYGFRLPGDAWDILPSPTYLVQLASLNAGDSWVGFPHENLGPTTATVVGQETVTVPAGTFNNAYKVLLRADSLGPLSQPVEAFWFVPAVGFVLDIGYFEDGSIDFATELVSFSGTGSGFFPMDVGNTWQYQETAGGISPVENHGARTWAHLVGAYPNPFNPQTRIVFEMAAPGQVRLAVHDLSGRLITTLVDGHRESGRQEVAWNGRDRSGQMAAAGVYLYRLETRGIIATRRFTLIK